MIDTLDCTLRELGWDFRARDSAGRPQAQERMKLENSAAPVPYLYPGAGVIGAGPFAHVRCCRGRQRLDGPSYEIDCGL